jgi:hypothetical protein
VRPRSARPLLGAALLVLLAPALRAQPLANGTWTGTLAPQRAQALAVEAAVEECAEGYKVGLTVGGRAAGDAEGVAWAASGLRFRFVEPRSRRAYACALRRQTDGSLAGSCAAPRTRPAALTLRPPAAAAFGCAE